MDTVLSKPGASKVAIQHHYDVGNEFYRLCLGPTMTYSCALWEDGDTLEQAQIRKMDYHLDQANVAEGHMLLDIGCGWGQLLKRAVDTRQARRAVGLTLSDAQYNWTRIHLGDPRIVVKTQSWEDHAPDTLYDAIISVGAIEHFVRPEFSYRDREIRYRHFFNKCRTMLKPGARMSLQTITYGRGNFIAYDLPRGKSSIKKSAFSRIFPESDLPRLEELIKASNETFEIIQIRNGRLEYAKTVERWLANLQTNREEALNYIRPVVLTNYEDYFASVIKGMQHRALYLYRITLERLG